MRRDDVAGRGRGLRLRVDRDRRTAGHPALRPRLRLQADRADRGLLLRGRGAPGFRPRRHQVQADRGARAAPRSRRKGSGHARWDSPSTRTASPSSSSRTMRFCVRKPSTCASKPASRPTRRGTPSRPSASSNAISEIRVLFTDIEMEGSMDGLKLAHAVRERWPPVSIMVTSGRSNVDEGGPARERLFFAKPYPPDDIVKALHGNRRADHGLRTPEARAKLPVRLLDPTLEDG